MEAPPPKRRRLVHVVDDDGPSIPRAPAMVETVPAPRLRKLVRVYKWRWRHLGEDLFNKLGQVRS